MPAVALLELVVAAVAAFADLLFADFVVSAILRLQNAKRHVRTEATQIVVRPPQCRLRLRESDVIVELLVVEVRPSRRLLSEVRRFERTGRALLPRVSLAQDLDTQACWDFVYMTCGCQGENTRWLVVSLALTTGIEQVSARMFVC